jgi:hypothetical protein
LIVPSFGAPRTVGIDRLCHLDSNYHNPGLFVISLGQPIPPEALSESIEDAHVSRLW